MIARLILCATLLVGVSTHAYAMTDDDFVAFRVKYHIPANTNNLSGFNMTFSGLVSELGGITAGELSCYKRLNGSGYCNQEWRGKGMIITETTEVGYTAPDNVTDQTLCRFYSNQTTKRCWDKKGEITDYAYGGYGWAVTQTLQFVWP